MIHLDEKQKEKIIADLVKCVDGLYMVDVEVLFDLARSEAFESAKIILDKNTSETLRNSRDTD